MSDNREKIINDFHEEIKHAYEPGAKVMSADRELRFCFELQRDRLSKKKLTCTEEMVRRGALPGAINNVRSWNDGHYRTTWAVDNIEHTKTYSRDGMRMYKKSGKQLIYETVVDVHDGEDVSNDNYCCPNCGAVSTIAALQEGCPHCGTSFKMTELYPKVSNFFYVRDIAGNGKELWHTVLKHGLCLLPVTIGMLLWLNYSEYGITPLDLLTNPGKLLWMLVCMVVMTPIVGYMGFFLHMFGMALKALIMDLPLIFSIITSRKAFAYRMSQISPEYTFERFSARMMSLLKIVAYSDRDDELPFYKGKDLGSLFDDVTDITFRGMATCKQVKARDNMVYVTADLYVETEHDCGTKIKAKRETYRVTAGRRLDVPFTTNFSITEIECKSCGGSFNAYKTNKCPYCGTEYRPEYEDWALYDIKKR